MPCLIATRWQPIRKQLTIKKSRKLIGGLRYKKNRIWNYRWLNTRQVMITVEGGWNDTELELSVHNRNNRYQIHMFIMYSHIPIIELSWNQGHVIVSTETATGCSCKLRIQSCEQCTFVQRTCTVTRPSARGDTQKQTIWLLPRCKNNSLWRCKRKCLNSPMKGDKLRSPHIWPFLQRNAHPIGL